MNNSRSPPTWTGSKTVHFLLIIIKEEYMNNRYEFGKRGSTFGILCIFDIVDDVTIYKMEAAMAKVPEEAQCSEKKMFSLYYEYPGYEQIQTARQFMDEIIHKFETLGWTGYYTPDNPGEGMDMGGLEDSSHPKFLGTEYQDYSREGEVGGYNLVRDFTIIMYKDEPSPVTETEIGEIMKISKKHF